MTSNTLVWANSVPDSGKGCLSPMSAMFLGHTTGSTQELCRDILSHSATHYPARREVPTADATLRLCPIAETQPVHLPCGLISPHRRDVHLCADGTLFPGSPSTFVNAGTWGLRPTSGEWYEVILGREFRAGRISGFVTLSRIGATTAAINDGVAVVSSGIMLKVVPFTCESRISFPQTCNKDIVGRRPKNAPRPKPTEKGRIY